jgi:hypothetical protein
MIFKFDNGFIDIRIKMEGNDLNGYEWLRTILDVSIQSGFKAIRQLDIHVTDFEYLYKSLIHLKNSEIDAFVFDTTECGLRLEAKLDITGNIKWVGIIQSPVDGTKLYFNLKSDNASIGHFADELWKILQEYPSKRKVD